MISTIRYLAKKNCHCPFDRVTRTILIDLLEINLNLIEIFKKKFFNLFTVVYFDK